MKKKISWIGQVEKGPFRANTKPRNMRHSHLKMIDKTREPGSLKKGLKNPRKLPTGE